MPSLPYSKKRYYLSGIDWIIGALNSYVHTTTSVGNHSTLILELSGKLSESVLKERLDTIFDAFPMLYARIVRDWVNLAPYFKVSSKSMKRYDFRVIESVSDDNYDAECRFVLNSPFSSGNIYFSFTLISCELRNVFLMTFDHRILDARGAELFLNLLADLPDESLRTSLNNIKSTDAPQLRAWSNKFAAGRTVQRKIISLTEEGCYTPSKYTMNDIPKTKGDNLLASFFHFSESQTMRILAESEKEAGFMMETPYLLAVTSLAMYRISGSCESLKYFVPVPIDMRKKGEEARHTFCNHLSFLFFYFEITPETGLKELICEIRRQLFMQISEEFPEDMIKAAYPGRIFPFWFLRRAMKFPFNGKMSSFVFANVGVSSFSAGNIVGTDVDCLYHMPRIPTPPGVGIFFNRYNNHLHLTVTSDKNALRSKFGSDLKDEISNSLLNESD
jgi:hypothetical protein